MRLVSAAVQQYLSETSAHGLGRITGARPLVLRLFWAGSFAALCVLCCVSLRQSLLRLQRQERSTAFYAESVEFVFPDLFVCGLSPFSASFSLNLTERQSDAVKAAMAAAEAALNGSWYKGSVKNVLHSMPYQLLADAFGHRIHQMVLMVEAKGAGMPDPSNEVTQIGNLSEFCHPEHVRCARVSFSDVERRLLRQQGNSMTIYLVADVQIPEFPVGNRTISFEMFGRRTYPPRWFFPDGWNVFGAGGLRLYLVQPRTYPADWATNVLLSPGTVTDLRVSMQQTDYTEEQFPGECVPLAEVKEVQFDNPYNAADPYTFEYSYEYCYYRELTHRMQLLLNCTPWRHPKPASFSHLRACDNATGLSLTTFHGQKILSQQLRPNISQSVSEISRLCAKRRPCSSRTYGVRATSVPWPQPAGVDDFVLLFQKQLYPTFPQPLPMLDFLLNFALKSNRVFVDPTEVTRMLRSQLLQVRLFADAEYSTRVVVSRDYTVMNFFAEAGGFLGLYLGCSVLTLGELVELLHNVISATAKDRCCTGAKVDDSGIKEAETGEMEMTDA